MDDLPKLTYGMHILWRPEGRPECEVWESWVRKVSPSGDHVMVSSSLYGMDEAWHPRSTMNVLEVFPADE